MNFHKNCSHDLFFGVVLCTICEKLDFVGSRGVVPSSSWLRTMRLLWAVRADGDVGAIGACVGIDDGRVLLRIRILSEAELSAPRVGMVRQPQIQAWCKEGGNLMTDDGGLLASTTDK